jgi:uncharacterized protein YjbI with pentapeptide repeats
MPTIRQRLAEVRRAMWQRPPAKRPADRLRPHRRRWRRRQARTAGQSDWRQTATTVAGIVSVLIVAAGLFYTNAANRAQQQLNERGQITDRFTKAIDQLGSDKLDVRLGGLYALERLMHDSANDPAGVSQVTNIIEVISAYVREHSRTSVATSPIPTGPPSASQADLPPLATDIQAALTILGRRPVVHNLDHVIVDLSGAVLTNANLTGANLALARLSGAKLYHADLDDANLNRADLTSADLSQASLTEAKIEDAKLIHARLIASQLWQADLVRSNFNSADLESAFFGEANLAGAFLVWTNMSGANLLRANLRSSRFLGAKLRGAYLGDVDLSGADMTAADLGEVFLGSARGLTNQTVQCSSMDEKTLLPAGIARSNPSFVLHDDLCNPFTGPAARMEVTPTATAAHRR